jgi:curli biogenesis system outer membrane secretion channel CsgG
MQNIMQERALAENGELQSDSNIGKGQLVAADFLLTPEVSFNENNSGGVGAAIGSIASSFFGVGGNIAGALAGGVKFKQAQTTLMLADARSGIQIAAAEGNVEKTDWGIGGVIGGSKVGVGAGAYTNTAEGKVIAAALLNNYNNIVQSIKSKPDLIAAKTPEPSKQNAKNSVQASAGINSGDVIKPKINGVKVFSEANDKSKIIGKLTKQDELIYLGDEKNGFVKVDGALSGWIDKRMILK